MHITIISVGTKPKNELRALIEEYESRLPKNVRVEWKYIQHGNGNPEQAKKDECKKIAESIPSKSNVVLLDERGSIMRSEEFSKLIFSTSEDVCFIIGGAYGVNESITQIANIRLSISSFVLPHQLVRLFLSEQIYRAYCISISHPYHHA